MKPYLIPFIVDPNSFLLGIAIGAVVMLLFIMVIKLF